MHLTLILVIAAAAAMIAVAIYLRQRRKSGGGQIVINGLTIPDTFAMMTATTGGVWVMANVTVPQFALDEIDAGIAMQIERATAKFPDWIAGSTLKDYSVMFLGPMARNQVTDPGSPALVVNGVQCAGTVIGTEPGSRAIIVLPDQDESGWAHRDYLRESARNESEHVRLAMNDRSLFDHFQGVNDIHPIFP
jgi:hypothetical protein